jgi:hypothetical protein
MDSRVISGRRFLSATVFQALFSDFHFYLYLFFTKIEYDL